MHARFFYLLEYCVSRFKRNLHAVLLPLALLPGLRICSSYQSAHESIPLRLLSLLSLSPFPPSKMPLQRQLAPESSLRHLIHTLSFTSSFCIHFLLYTSHINLSVSEISLPTFSPEATYGVISKHCCLRSLSCSVLLNRSTQINTPHMFRSTDAASLLALYVNPTIQ